jgi:hypothetical protein
MRTMNRPRRPTFALALLGTVAFLVAATPAHANGILLRVLRVLGMSAGAGQMKGPDTEAGPGQIWIANLADDTRHAVTPKGGYRWPVFEMGGKTMIALGGSKVVRIALPSGKLDELRDVPGLEKLVGFDPAYPDEVLVVRNNTPAVPLAMLSIKTGKLTPLPLDRNDKDQNKLLAAARGETRVYESRRLFLQTESRAALEGTREWQNVYVQEGNALPRAVSRCKDVVCHQPSLSPDGAHVVYVQSDPDQ